MIVAFSTSSPWASVALLDASGPVASDRREAAGAAGAACLRMLESLLASAGLTVGDLAGCVADVGPGSFSGTRVGVTLAKTLAFALGVRAAGVDAFDLIDPSTQVAIPVRRATYLLRRPGEAPVLSESVEGATGYGAAFDAQHFPQADRVEVGRLQWVQPRELVPVPLLEPSISTPKKPFAPRVDRV